MHRYSIPGDTEKYVYAVLFVAAVFVALGLAHLARMVGFAAPWWLSIPTPLAVFGVLLWAFDILFWKIPMSKNRTISNVPNLKGSWTGTLTSDHDQGNSKIDTPGHAEAINISITQTWRRILIVAHTSNSWSWSTSASIVSREPLVIHYIYENSPSNDATSTMMMHTGTCELRMIERDQLKGDYYTDRNRRTTGTMALTKTQVMEGSVHP